MSLLFWSARSMLRFSVGTTGAAAGCVWLGSCARELAVAPAKHKTAQAMHRVQSISPPSPQFGFASGDQQLLTRIARTPPGPASLLDSPAAIQKITPSRTKP